MKSVEVEILGKKYVFKSDDPDRLQKCTEYLKTEMEEFSKKYSTINQNKLFVLYSLMLTEKLFDEIDKNADLTKKIEQINSLLKHIE
jgi:cell division protein ZapA (FtsZ GTPase activity inhibitor)